MSVQRYDNPAIIVTENGFAVKDESKLEGDAALNDEMRINYLQDYLAEVGKAKKYDDVNVQGYFVWSLLGT